jgi:hypothetical protein
MRRRLISPHTQLCIWYSLHVISLYSICGNLLYHMSCVDSMFSIVYTEQRGFETSASLFPSLAISKP